MLSRVADSFYWMGRYMERAENVARYVDATLNVNLDNPGGQKEQWEPLIAVTGDLEAFNKKYPHSPKGAPAKSDVLKFVTFDTENPNSIISSVSQARENARTIRGHLSQEAWEHLNRCNLMMHAREAPFRAAQAPADFYASIRDAGYVFEGITSSTLSHGEEWHFLRLGRMLERADQTSRLLDVKYYILLPNPADVGSVYDDLLWAVLLQSVSGYEMYRRRHGRISPSNVVDFLVLDRLFPRSIFFGLASAEQSLLALSGTPWGEFSNLPEKKLSRLRSELAYLTVEEIFTEGLHEFLDRVQAGILQVGAAIQEAYLTLGDPASQVMEQ